METTLYMVMFNDGRVYNINCRGKNQKKRFKTHVEKLKSKITGVQEISNGIHTITEFEKLKE